MPVLGATGAGRRRRRGRRLAAALTAMGVFSAGCGDARGAITPPPAAPLASSSSAPPAVSGRARPAAPGATPTAESAPAAGAAVPTDPARLADALVNTEGLLRSAIDGWTDKNEPAPEPVVLAALYEQRVYRYLARNPKVASRTFDRLPKPLAGRARDNVTAVRGLLSLAHPVGVPVKIKIATAEPADVLLADIRRAERRFGVDWQVLAAVMFVETKFGRVRSPSYTGARGPMQFMPGTWKAYGMGGDIDDTRDALLAAANYLRASGAPRDYRRALYAYNHSQAYVDAVLLHARQMRQDVRNYYAYYNWQVFVITTRGERRLTGPSS
ncbi:lytic transglycosylase domain-containing protein [Microbispora sp. RL4-1S]|uniref:Lytic transglycosylase domain-containing protein n=1 Tax=Microbispora oryzae TaxID=2806554 RepID=A0A941AJN1_9ACTN|nr:lytic transglycosylase domain-containing protein [Microbispora oryzae]MBP2706391.1 lytic transglycosylase domain-containing protein [Microbispora oryzae]